MQTKFSRPSVQEPSNCPYPLDAAIEEQVRISIENSLRNLRHIDDESEEIYIDTLILHSPYPDFSDTLKAWRIFESYVPHRIRALGISNITLPILKQLYDAVKIKPVFVQNRFYPESAFDVPLRKFCAEKEIVFQAHKVLKGNKNLLDSELLRDIASNFGFTVEIAFYFCVLGLVGGVQVVNGTKSEEHMKEDLESLKTFKQWLLDPKNQASWDQKMMLFKSMIGDASLWCLTYVYFLQYCAAARCLFLASRYSD